MKIGKLTKIFVYVTMVKVIVYIAGERMVRMDEFNLSRFQEVLQNQRITAALLSNPATLTWLSGYAPPIQTGPSPFEGGQALGWWQSGELTLVLSDAEAPAASALGARTRDYLSYTIEAPIAGMEHHAAALEETLRQAGAPRGKIGVEFNFLSAPLAAVLEKAFPNSQLVPLDGAFSAVRAVKSGVEIEKIKASLALCDRAQAFIADSARAGQSEIELWGALKADLESTAGGRLPVLADLVAGLRTADVGGLPGGYQIQPGDAIIADIVPRLDGYWGDNAGTHFAGQPVPALEKAYRDVRAALQKGIQAVRPGLKACDLDRLLRQELTSQGYPPYPHHSGHGIGATFHEEPRLVAYNQLALQPGMVVAIEPGAYLPGIGGVRLEDVVLVTAGGCEILTRHLKA
jgi:Xaa-Pro dipeptidase